MKIFPFADILLWYKKYGRQWLPWREYHYDAKTLGYRVWLSETMLQQTQAERVKNYFTNIITAFPTVESLARSEYEDFFYYYKWLWYYSRARNMLKAAKIVVEDFWWVFPKETSQLQKLPWVWPYTAEAIRAFSYDIATLSFDTNLEKIFARYYHGDKCKKLTQKEKDELIGQFEKFCKKTQWNEWISRSINNALMDFWALVSLANPDTIDWENYPLKDCKFYRSQGNLEEKKPRNISRFPHKQAYIIAVLHKDHKKYFSDTHRLLNQNEQHISSYSLWEKSLKIRDTAKGFIPFFIWKNTGNPRDQIQKYFMKNYHLEVSVRPPEIKSYNQYEAPYIVCYCQVQSWTHTFEVYEDIKVRGFEEWYVELLEFWEQRLF